MISINPSIPVHSQLLLVILVGGLLSACSNPAPVDDEHADSTESAETKPTEATPDSDLGAFLSATDSTIWFVGATQSREVVLFDDELQQLEEALADRLGGEDGDYEVLSPGKMREHWSALRAGHIPGVDGICPVPPIPHRLTPLLLEAGKRVYLHLHCDSDSCYINLRFTDADGATESENQMPLPKGRNLERWTEAIRDGDFTARPRRSAAMASIEDIEQQGTIWSEGAVHASFRPGTLATTGTWNEEPSNSLLQPVAEALDECRRHDDPDQKDVFHPHTLEIADDGQVTRCDDAALAWLPSPGFDCQCQVLKTLNFGPGEDRRARFQLATRERVPDENQQRVRLEFFFTADDESAIVNQFHEAPPISRVAQQRCLATLDPTFRGGAEISLEIGAMGEVEEVTVNWPDELPNQAAQCLNEVLADAQFNCPLTGRARLTGDLQFEGPSAGFGDDLLQEGENLHDLFSAPQ